MKSDKKEFLVKKLESVGKTTLVKYFDLFNDYKNFRSNSDIKEAFKEEKWLEDSINTKASVGKNIFYKGLEWNALELIIQSKKLHSDIISTAEDILKRKEEYINSESEIGVTVLKSGNLAILARELIYWITMQEDLAKELILDKVITNAKSDDIIEYSCRQFGKGTFIYAVNSRKAKIENKNVFSSPFNPHTFEIYNDKNNFYLTNEWSKKAHNFNIDKVVDFINENSDNFEVNIKYGNINFLYIKDKEVFECANLTEEESIQGKNENQENSKTQKVIGNIDKYKYKEDDLYKRKRIISYADLNKIFISRLKSQNRKYSDNLYFYPVLFNRIKELNYSEYIQEQLSKLNIYTENNQCEFSDFDHFIIDKGTLYGCKDYDIEKSKKKYKPEKLFFFIGDNKDRFSSELYFRNIKDISLEHKVALRDILNGLKKENKIPELLKLSAKMNSYNCSFKTSEDLDKITESEYFTDNIKSKLKKELDLIHKKTVLEILPLKINSAKGCSK